MSFIPLRSDIHSPHTGEEVGLLVNGSRHHFLWKPFSAEFNRTSGEQSLIEFKVRRPESISMLSRRICLAFYGVEYPTMEKIELVANGPPLLVLASL